MLYVNWKSEKPEKSAIDFDAECTEIELKPNITCMKFKGKFKSSEPILISSGEESDGNFDGERAEDSDQDQSLDTPAKIPLNYCTRINTFTPVHCKNSNLVSSDE